MNDFFLESNAIGLGFVSSDRGWIITGVRDQGVGNPYRGRQGASS